MKTKKTQSKSSKLSVGQKLKESSQLYLLMLPSIIIFLIFTYYPMYGVIIAFKDFKPALGIMGSKWVGMKNFITFFKSYQFSVTIKNTIVISLYTIAVTFPLPIIMALMVNQIRSTKFKKFLQVATYLPHFISVVVMSGMIILFLSPSTGIIAKLVGLLGFKLPNLMGSASAFPHIYVWTEAWQHVGWDSILYIATLSSVDPSLYEAAVEWMHMLWENGVLDPEYFTQDGSAVTAKLQAAEGSRIGIMNGWTADSEAGTNAKQYSLMEAVEGYNGVHYVEAAPTYLDIADRELVITTACEDPEALLKWADNFYDDLVSLQTFYGSLDVTVTANDDGTYSVHSTDDDTSLDTAAWSNALRDFGPKYMNPEFYDKVIIPDDVSDGIKLKEDEVNAKYVTTDKNTGMPVVQYTEDELSRITAIGTDVYSYVEAMYAHWVVDGGVEDEWDSYIEQLNAMGLEEFVSLQQGAYAAYLESME